MSSESEVGYQISEIPQNTILIVFGASGDLTRRKLMPALYHLAREMLLPTNFLLIGIGRRILEGQEFINHMQNRVRQYCSHRMEGRYWKPLASKIVSIKNDFNNLETFNQIGKIIENKEREWKAPANKLIYLATSPSHFTVIIENSATSGLSSEAIGAWTRLIVEKPFGLNLQSANLLYTEISKHFAKKQIFNIDHFLGKESVQNILIFRMSNLMFQPMWNRDYIEQIQITSAETIGVEGRVGFFEQTGAVRDMIQSHLLQILAFVTMEHPESLNPEMIRYEKLKLLRSIRKYSKQEAGNHSVRGQYIDGVVNSELVRKYVQEEGISEYSRVETYAALKLYIDNVRWKGVPFYLRTGKRMPQRKSEVFIQLKQLDDLPIPKTLTKEAPIPNVIRLQLQPSAGIDLTIGWKPTGLLKDVEPSNLHLSVNPDIKEPKAYERLLVDAMNGDWTLFLSFEEIQEMWKIVDPIIENWENKNLNFMDNEFPSDLHFYPAGTQGPKSTNKFIESDGCKWNPI
ncbi:MAG: glucose-6-phosphate dehydrogenase [Candidatus Heimdallarchaeota archaeon]|nr:glucose-6-phosphate dehydrogenase [Candidatus Heimdallarchaeota archaeon]